MEVQLKQLPVVFVDVNQLKNNDFDPSTLSKKFVQVSKKSNYKSVKERILDCVNNALNQKLQLTDIRLWKSDC